MYNRYIPQGDGSFRRSSYPEPPPPRQPGREPDKEPEPTPPPLTSRPSQHRRPLPPRPRKQTENVSVGRFLRQLIPGDFDTEDLLIVLLLLLMSGDCKEDQNTALLTLALYLFL